MNKLWQQEAQVQERLLTKKLKEIRKRKELTLEKLAQLSGLSKGYLSQIENSDDPPPIATLSRISRALGIDISELFAETSEMMPYSRITVGRRGEHRLLSRAGTPHGYTYEDLAPNKRGKNMEPFLVTVGFDKKIDIQKDFQHEGEEFIYVLEGTLEFFYEGKSYCILEPGDHVYFDSDRPHSGRSIGGQEAKLLIIMYSYKRL